MGKRSEDKILISGAGGQGILFLGKILAHAALLEGKNTSWVPSYGAEVRGGVVHSMVVIAQDEVTNPVVQSPDTCIVMSQQAYDRYLPLVKPGARVLLDSTLVRAVPPPASGIEVVRREITRAAHLLGDNKVANIVMLGVYVATTRMLKTRSIQETMALFIPRERKELLDLNRKAFERGLLLGEKGR